MKKLDPIRFALIGASGFVAPRHLRAIKENGGELLAALDPSDSAGILDSYFPEAAFFTEFERFDRFIDKMRRNQSGPDFISVCSPNYLHDAHVRFGLRSQADVICEKPLVLNPWNLEALMELEKEYGHRVYTILQLRLHPSIVALKERILATPPGSKSDVDLTYITSRGKWYYASWKGDESKSGGIATNIGIHFFDMLIWVFGEVRGMEVHQRSHDRASGYIELERANVRWFLSISEETLPAHAREKGIKSYRSLTCDGQEVQFSDGFTDLHSLSYRDILNGRGFGLREAAASIHLAHAVRTAPLSSASQHGHPFQVLPQSAHPFLG